MSKVAVAKANDGLLFSPLFAGKEDTKFAQRRYNIFEAQWHVLEDSLNVGDPASTDRGQWADCLQKILLDAQAGVIQEVTSFVERAHLEV